MCFNKYKLYRKNNKYAREVENYVNDLLIKYNLKGEQLNKKEETKRGDKMSEYVIDRQYEKVYEYNKNSNCNEYLCNFYSIDAHYKNRDKTIISKIENWKNKNS